MFKAGSVITKVGADLAPLKNAFAAARREAGGFATRMNTTLLRVGNSFAGVTSQVAAMAGGLSAAAALGTGIKLAADFEQAGVAMEVMLGSVEKSKAMLAGLTEFAANTPFEFTELMNASRQLIAFQIEGAKVIPTLRMIGDVSAGIGAPVGEMAFLFGQIRSQGKAMTQDLNQFAGRGIPIYTELAKVLGTNEAGVKKMAEQSQISFSLIERAFANMSGAGGQFANMMARQNMTVAGQFSNLKDAVSQSLREVGQTLIQSLDMRSAITGITAEIGRLAKVVVPVIADATRWIAANKELAYSLAKWTAAVGVGVVVLPKLVSVGQAVATTFTAAGYALKFAFANPLLTIGVGAVGAFTAVLARSIAMNESWSESAYQMSRSIGLFRSATQDLAEAQRTAGAITQEVGSAKLALRSAIGVDDRIESTRELVIALQKRLDVSKQIASLQQQSGMDVGYSDKAIAGIRAELRRSTAQMDALQQMKAQAQAAKYAMNLGPMPTMNLGPNPSEFLTHATRGLREQTVAATGLEDALAGLRKEYWQLGLDETAKGLMDLAAMGANLDQLKEAENIFKSIEDSRKRAADALAFKVEKPGQENRLPPLIRAGSAQAVQFAFQQKMGKDDIPKKHLAVSEAILRVGERLLGMAGYDMVRI